MGKSIKTWLAAAALAFLASAVSAQTQAQLAVGRDYVDIVPPQPTDTPAKIEVVEFFSYACPHCSELNPQLKAWADKLPADVSFRRVAVPGSPFYLLMAKLYYSLEATGDLARLDQAVFDAIHVRGVRLFDEKSVSDWVVSQGVDARKFSSAFHSFSVDNKLKRADQLARAAKIRGVPALAVDGRYLVVGEGIRSYGELLTLTERLIDKRRAELAPKAKPAAKETAKAARGGQKK